MHLCDLTYTERRRFRHFSICPFCFRQISDADSFELQKTTYGKHQVYTYFHTNCLVELHKYEDAYTQLSEEIYPGVNTQKGDKNVAFTDQSIETAVSPVITQGATKIPPLS